ncbi:glycosyltransferase family 2 protein [Dactylosporangium sp. CA-152071]|uniref:glycosyltransferase family 2 protein n=1 Tax=Dactylosporangium sp. CA-152071 TaxID=3239933 RepID=UPI003D8E8282
MSLDPLVSVVLVSYNTRELTLKNLAGLQAGTAVPIEIIVVDNASTDNSAAAIGHAYPEVRVLHQPVNLGFGNAVNLGAAHAKGRWILLINPDTEPVGDVIRTLVEYAGSHPEYRIYTGRTLRADHTDDGHSVHALPSLWGYVCFATGLSSLRRRSQLFNPDELPGLDRVIGGEVPAVSGCLLLIDRPLWEQLGGFTPDYFMYSEDIDLSARARDLGARPVLVPEAQLLHVGGAASSTVNKRIMVLRGKTTFVRLRWSPGRAKVARLLMSAGVLVRSAAGAGWRDVWRQRATWLSGWPAPTAPAAVPTQPLPAPISAVPSPDPAAARPHP